MCGCCGSCTCSTRPRAGRSGYYGYAYGDDRSIELSAIESRQLWPLLDEAEAAGLRLVYPGKLGSVRGYWRTPNCAWT